MQTRGMVLEWGEPKTYLNVSQIFIPGLLFRTPPASCQGLTAPPHGTIAFPPGMIEMHMVAWQDLDKDDMSRQSYDGLATLYPLSRSKSVKIFTYQKRIRLLEET